MEDQADQGKVHHDMRDLNLGPDSKRLVERYREFTQGELPLKEAHVVLALQANSMAAMLERWITVGWCWPDACPATICGGPHVKVRYEDNRMGSTFRPCEVIEPYNQIGTTFKEVPYRVITN
jgi:hypothetical protein